MSRDPAVCFLENEDLDRRIPNVWGFQLLHSATTQPPAKSKPFTPLVNFTPLSEDRGLSSYPLHRSLPLRLSVSGPSAADSAASGPSAVNVSVCGPSAACVTTAGHSAVYCPTPSGPSADCRSTSGPSAAPVTTSGLSASCINNFGPSAAHVTTTGSNATRVVTPGPCAVRFIASGPSAAYSADHRRLSTPPTSSTSAPSALPHQALPPSNPFALKCSQVLAQSRVTELSLAPNKVVWGTVNSQPPGK